MIISSLDKFTDPIHVLWSGFMPIGITWPTDCCSENLWSEDSNIFHGRTGA